MVYQNKCWNVKLAQLRAQTVQILNKLERTIVIVGQCDLPNITYHEYLLITLWIARFVA